MQSIENKKMSDVILNNTKILTKITRILIFFIKNTFNYQTTQTQIRALKRHLKIFKILLHSNTFVLHKNTIVK